MGAVPAPVRDADGLMNYALLELGYDQATRSATAGSASGVRHRGCARCARAPGGHWIYLVRAPAGLTLVPDDSAEARWAGRYGDVAHALDLPGRLAALTGSLASAAIPVFAASTFPADVLPVPRGRRDEAVAVARRAGHEVLPAEPSGGQA